MEDGDRSCRVLIGLRLIDLRLGMLEKEEGKGKIKETNLVCVGS